MVPALGRPRLHVRKGPLGARLAEHVLRLAATLLRPGPPRAHGVGPALLAAAPRREAAGRARADAVLGGRAGSFLDEARRARGPAAVALLDAVLAPREGAVGAGAALPHGRRRTVDGDVGARRALVADQLGARLWVGVLVVAGREDGLVIWADCGQNMGCDVSHHCT